VISSPRLTGRRILITRTPDRASALAAGLEREGAIVFSIPTIEIVPPASYAPLDKSLGEIGRFDWIVFTSAHAVEVFGQRRPSEPSPRGIAVIGPATARAVEQLGLTVTLVPPRAIAESLGESLQPEVNGAEVLLIRAAQARDVLPAMLTQAGACLTIVDAYRNQIPEESIPRLREVFSSPEKYPEAITFTSASTARNLIAMLDSIGLALPHGIALASIGPITSQAMRELELEPTVEAAEANIPALTSAIADYFSEPA
jgi:uroporphyrinogen-III synthase